MMKDYKVETLYYQMKGFSMSNLNTQPKIDIQAQLDLYASKGYKFISTTSTGDSTSFRIFLYFEKDV